MGQQVIRPALCFGKLTLEWCSAVDKLSSWSTSRDYLKEIIKLVLNHILVCACHLGICGWYSAVLKQLEKDCLCKHRSTLQQQWLRFRLWSCVTEEDCKADCFVGVACKWVTWKYLTDWETPLIVSTTCPSVNHKCLCLYSLWPSWKLLFSMLFSSAFAPLTDIRQCVLSFRSFASDLVGYPGRWNSHISAVVAYCWSSRNSQARPLLSRQIEEVADWILSACWSYHC